MALIIRIDVDRPYGRVPFSRHVLSRISSDLYLPKVNSLGYLTELRTMLSWLNDAGARAYAFFRRCTLPCPKTLAMLQQGRHVVGLHLENSRSYATFQSEIKALESHCQHQIRSFSKHGSGGAKYGWRHFAPYEPEKYIDWAQRSGMKVFFGNLEDPRLLPQKTNGLSVFPSAFWLEPSWRDTKTFTIEWLTRESQLRDIVLLVHPENILADTKLVTDFRYLIASIPTKIFE